MVKLRTDVWELARTCDTPLPGIVHMIVKLGAWTNEADVENDLAETVCSLLSDPQSRTHTSSSVRSVTDAAVARALLDAGAADSPVSPAVIAARAGTSRDLVTPVLERLLATGLVRSDDAGRVSIQPEDARAMTAIADEQIPLDDVAT